ncbi:MAG: hypothetical protein CM1200mP30_23230 [Pseudomonadota bacterium]|nr:MAG: hypothetical protein CM1200mP30_23230 [Pseudomonadota bacterium]
MQDEFLKLQSVLSKTILFVTHDFDEALRLADRIAIMKDGVIEQLDTRINSSKSCKPNMSVNLQKKYHEKRG